jgi:carbamoyl-phosphate synthase small subunit
VQQGIERGFMKKGVLVLGDGTVVEGLGIGAEGDAQGEVVFATSMVGYQESLTDPSYKYQILMPTYPLIGNYGVTPERFESDKIQVEGFIVRELCEKPSHGRMIKTLDAWLKEEGIPGLQGVDTRFLTRKIREHGVMNGLIKSDYDPSELESLKEQAAHLKSISELDLVDIVTTKKPIVHEPVDDAKKSMVLIDCGVKGSIIRCLLSRGVRVTQVPARTSAREILDYEPDGVMVSNGPGDPDKMGDVVSEIKKLLDAQLPTVGICFGNQLLGKAFGGSTYKLKFGHRGANQPVKELESGKVYVTSQNHGFAVDGGSLDGTGAYVSHINLNDGSVEGLRHKELPAFCVQYHPEAFPGPHDSDYIFDDFVKLMETKR